MKKIYTLLLVSFITLFFIGCAKTPYTNRSQIVMVSPQQESQMGYQAAKEVLKKERISKNRRLNAIVRNVGTRIAKAAAQPNYKWEFFLIEKDVMNAFCLPGGKVFVYTGLFKAAKNEDQLAVVVAHETAHALARHGAERMSMIQLGRLGHTLISQTLQGSGYSQLFNTAYGITEKFGMVLPYSRKFEYEADEIGLYLMTKAGYNPKESIKFWNNMRKLKKGNTPPEYLSTHPADINRINRLKQLIPAALKHYR